MPTKAGVSARAIAKDYSGPDFSLTDEQINAADFLAKSNLPAYIINPDGDRIEVDAKKFNAFLSGNRETVSASDPSSELKPENLPSSDTERQIRHLQSEGMTPEQIAEVLRPGSASIGAVSHGIDTNPVITPAPQRNTKASPNSESSTAAPAPSKFVAAQGESIRRDVEYRASFGGPSLRHDLFGWGNYQADRFVFNPIRRAFGRPERTPETHSYEGGRVIPRSTQNQKIGVSSNASIGPTGERNVPGSVTETVVVTNGSTGSLPQAAESGSLTREANQAPALTDNNFSVSGRGKDAGRASMTSADRGLKRGIAGAIGNKVGGRVAGFAGKIKGAVDTVQLGARALGGDVSAMIQLGAKGLKWAWNNKEKLAQYAIGIGGGMILAPLLALYAMVAPWLAALTPATLIGAGIGGFAGFMVGGPLGMVAGAGIGASIAANWGAITAGISNALASIAGIGGTIGGAIGGLGAAFAAPAAAIGGLAAVAVAFTTFITSPPAINQVIFGSDDFQTAEIIVEKTATPSQVSNNTAAEIEYKVTIKNTIDQDWDISVKDTDIKVYKVGLAPVSLIMPDPVTELPKKLTKDNNETSPLVITYKKFPIKAGQYNDSQIINVVEVTATDPITKSVKTFTAQAKVVIGSIDDDHPYGFPSSGWLSSVDSEPCSDHQGVFYGIAGAVKGGLDIVAAPNSVVLSTMDGTVTAAKWDENSYSVGGYVYITSKSGDFVAAYLHMNTPIVKVGDQVQRGQPLGTIYPSKLPTTGGPHVHYQVIQRINGQWVNVNFADPSRAGGCLADPSNSADTNVTSRVLVPPTYTQAGCSRVPRSYTMQDSVQQDTSCN